MYHQDLLDEAKHPNNYGKLESADLITTNYNASCGDVITVQIKLSEDKKTIQDIRWQGQGCIISQAAMSVLSEKIKGYAVADLHKLTSEDVLLELGLTEISMGRIKCLVLGLGALKKVL